MPYRKLSDVVLRNGEPAELAIATAPTPEWRERICSFLNSPPRPEGPSFHEFLLTEELPELEVRYTMVLHQGEIAGCVFTFDNSVVGYIQSTFVLRQKRQLGVARALMCAIEEDFADRGGKIRYLTTRTDSPAETLFEGFGYAVLYKRDGRTGMEKSYAGTSWEDYYAVDSASLRIEDMNWSHWPAHHALMWSSPNKEHRALGDNFRGRIREILACPEAHWMALVSPDGKLVGDALLRPHDSWGELRRRKPPAYVLDLFVHQRFRDAAARLFDAILPATGHVQTFLDASETEKIELFRQRGFTLEASFRDDFNHHNEGTPDICVYGRTI